MSEHIHKSHNKTLLLYHMVCPVKYRRKVFRDEEAATLKDVCSGISERYEIYFVEIGIDEDHAHFLVQSVPALSVKEIVQIVKSITAKEIFRKYPKLRDEVLWGGQFWTDGYYANTVGQYGNEEVIRNYVKGQGGNYQQLHQGQLLLF